MLNRILNTISSVSNQGAPGNFKFVIGDKIDVPFALYELYSGRAKSGIINIPGIPIPDLSSVNVSVFIYRKSNSGAANAWKKLVSLRHPSILHVLDSGETESAIFIATEHASPLSLFSRSSLGEISAIAGLYQLAKALEFLREEANLIHGSVDPANVFVTDSGSFRLGGFELARAKVDAGFVYDKRNCNSGIFSKIECRDLADLDLFGYLLVLSFLANSTPSGSSVSALADSISRAVSEPFLLNLVSELSRIKKISKNSNAFHSNETVQILEYLETIHVRGEEAVRFLDGLPARLPRVSKSFQKGVLLESILTSVLSISSLVASAIPTLLEIGAKMSRDEFILKVQPKIIQLFSVQDRGIRFRLLAGLSSVVSLIDPNSLEKTIVFDILSGLTDSHPSIREQSLRGVVEVSAYVSLATVEKQIVPQLMRLLKDPEPAIRTNVINSISKVGKGDSEEIRSLAITAGLRDTCSPAKLAALKILTDVRVNSQANASEMTCKYLPLTCPLLSDPDAEVANSAFQVVSAQLEKVKRYIPEKPVKKQDAPALELKSSVVPSEGMSLHSVSDFGQFSRSVPPKIPVNGTNFDSFWDDIAQPAPPTNWNNTSLI